ncbi:hypothetical protein ABIB37_001315 [Agrococcus sp. UYP10]|uniref:DUF4166 domain-containing protein n=1 Tax=Agrococcus sp. UYP10 TaxID=1756355 RepID=UPI003395EEB5
MSASVYERVLGERFAELDPTLRRYCGVVPAGQVGRGEGVYAIAGSRWRMLRPILRLLAARDVLFPERGTGVGLRVENRYDADGTLHAVRTFAFPHVERRMVDAMRVERGTLIDRLGARGGLEVALDAEVRDGGLALTSRRIAWRVGALRVPLPPIAGVRVTERVDAASGQQHVDVRVRAVVLGEVFRYTGAFDYRVEDDRAATPVSGRGRRGGEAAGNGSAGT